MAQKEFKLMRAPRVLLLVAGIAIAGLVTFSAAVVLQKTHKVDASSNNNLGDILPSQMTKMTPSYVYDGAEVDSSVNSTQSLAITDDYFITVQAHSTNENSGWIVATDFANPSSTPVWEKSYSVGHGNAATWNNNTNQIVIADGYKRFFFNADNGNYVNSINVNTYATGIAYNSVRNQYIQTAGDDGEILDSNFNLLMTFDAGNRLVNQDVGYHNGYIYRVAWGGCDYLRDIGRTQDADYCDQYFGNNSNVIYQFDLNGNFTGAFYIEAGFGELESLAFGPDGAMYLLFNGKPDSLHYSVYKSDLEFIGKQYITFANASVTKTYGDANFTNTATTTGDGAITYSSSNTNVASVNATTGEVTIRGVGTANITATAAATANYDADSKSYNLTVNKIPSVKPDEVNEIRTGYYTDTLSTIKFSTEGLVWKNEDEIIQLGQNVYEVYYTENNDTTYHTTETYKVMVDGIRRVYEVISGDGQIYDIDNDGKEYISFTIDVDYDLFESGGEIYVDENLLDKEYYETSAGSTIVDINNDYLNTLNSGKHTLAVYFEDGGVATADFVLVKKEEAMVPETAPQDTGMILNDDDVDTAAPNTGTNGKDGSTGGFSLIFIIPVALAALTISVRNMKNNSKKHRKFDLD